MVIDNEFFKARPFLFFFKFYEQNFIDTFISKKGCSFISLLVLNLWVIIRTA